MISEIMVNRLMSEYLILPGFRGKISYSEVLPDLKNFHFTAALDGYVLAHGAKKFK